MQPNPPMPPSIIKYNFFRFSFIFTLVMLACYITFLVLAINMCTGNCLANTSRFFPCTNGGTLYCCSTSSSTGPYSCAWFTDCIYDNDSCGTYNTLSWVTGSLLFLGFCLMIVAACRFRSKRRFYMMQQGAYQNLNNQPYYNAGQPQYGSPPIIYNNGVQPQNPNFNQSNAYNSPAQYNGR